MSEPLRLLVFDRTCTGRGLRPGLSDAWGAGGALYRGLGRLDGALGVTHWDEALDWLVERTQATGRPLGEVQYWGHGRRGRAYVAADVLDVDSLRIPSARQDRLRAVRDAFAPASSGFWFRTCETLGGPLGQAFARTWSDFFAQRVAGHTHVIGFWQSGLHSLAPGTIPSWSATAGMRDPADPAAVALGSAPGLPNTIHCLQGAVPAGW